MTVGIDIRNVGRKRTGDETVFVQLIRQLACLDRENEYKLFLDERTPEQLSAIEQTLDIKGRDNFRFVTLFAKNKFDWNFRVLPKYLRRHPVDVYHTQYILPVFVPRSIKLVTHIHDVSFKAYPEYIHWKDRFFLAILIPWSLRRADKVIAVSQFTRDEIMKYYALPKEKIAVVLNALGEDFLSGNNDVSSERMELIRKKYQLPEKFLLYVGTLQPRKNIPALIKAFALLKEKCPDMKLVLAGNRSGHNIDSRIDAAIEEHSLEERVIFPGYIDQGDLPFLVRAAHLFVFPSLYEGFGIPLLEAMSQGVPVVAADTPCLREVGGEAALFVDVSDLAVFMETLYNACIDQKVRERYVRAGMGRVRDFSWAQSAKKLLETYRSVLR